MNEQELCVIFGKNVKKYRKRRRWSQEELAEQVNISAPFLSNVETGKAWISPKTIANLSNVFNIDAFELFKPDIALQEDSAALINKYTKELKRELNQILNTSLDKICAGYCGV